MKACCQFIGHTVLKRMIRAFGVALMFAHFMSCGDARHSVPIHQLSISEFALPDGSHMQLSEVLGTKATLFLTLDPECPMTLGYAPMLDSLQRTLPTGVAMIGFYPAPYIVPDSALHFAEAHHLDFVQLMDPECILAEALQARVTPEAFLVDSSGLVLYRGAIDDSAVREGRKRTPSKFHLADALHALAANKAIMNKEVPALGCIVECAHNDESKE